MHVQLFIFMCIEFIRENYTYDQKPLLVLFSVISFVCLFSLVSFIVMTKFNYSKFEQKYGEKKH